MGKKLTAIQEVLQQAQALIGKSQRQSVEYLINFYKLEDIPKLTTIIRRRYYQSELSAVQLIHLKLLQTVLNEILGKEKS